MDFSQECSSPTGEVIQSFENVANFIKACRGLIGDDAALCASDLEDMSLGERPGVADCCLALHAWWLGQQAGGASPRGSASFRASFGSASSGATPPAATPTHTPAVAGLRSSPTLSPAGLPQPPSPRGGSPSRVEFSFTPHATSAVNHATTQRCNDGLEFLMRTCNHMLKSSMGVPISSPLPQPPSNAGGMPSEIAIHAVGPVLESVLQTLTEVSAVLCCLPVCCHSWPCVYPLMPASVAGVIMGQAWCAHMWLSPLLLSNPFRSMRSGC